jgi:uncharacterized protein
LDPADSARLDRVAGSLPSVSKEALQAARPWLAALQLSLALTASQGHAAEQGVERQLEADAARLNKPTRYLETAEQQIQVFSGLSPEGEVRFLSATLRQIEEEADETAAIDRLWVSGEVDALAAALNRMIGEAGPELAQALLYDRNRRWADTIETLIHGKGEVFVAVGAAHLAGPNSVVDVLRQRGFSVEGP